MSGIAPRISQIGGRTPRLARLEHCRGRRGTLERMAPAVLVRACFVGSFCAAIGVLGAPAFAAERVVLPLVVHVARGEGGPVVPEGFVAERVARANEIFAPYGVGFVVQRTVLLPGEHALETRADRDALGAHAKRGAIDVFFVRSLRDVDDPAQMRRGVHWRSQTFEGSHYVIVSSIAGLNVLAHELGHFLGNHAHSEVAGNLMSYTQGEGLPVLDETQQRRLGRTVREYLQSGELRASAEAAR